jgi:hypothetical protein
MPKYTFECKACKVKTQKYTSVSVKDIVCPECFAMAERILPNISGAKTTETVDKLFNKKHVADQSNIMKERKLDYYWEVEVPKMVNSGTYSIETMLEQNWVFYNERGELVTRTKPPEKC